MATRPAIEVVSAALHGVVGWTLAGGHVERDLEDRRARDAHLVEVAHAAERPSGSIRSPDPPDSVVRTTRRILEVERELVTRAVGR